MRTGSIIRNRSKERGSMIAWFSNRITSSPVQKRISGASHWGSRAVVVVIENARAMIIFERSVRCRRWRLDSTRYQSACTTGHASLTISTVFTTFLAKRRVV